MSAIIYETVNLFNKKNNILPYRYIGSDQHNKPSYLGSSKELCVDIKKLGVDQFEKRTLCEFKEEISNILLRKIESQIQTYLGVAKDETYYNRTNSSLRGYEETDEQREARKVNLLKNRKIWWESLTEEQREEEKKKSGKFLAAYNRSTKGKTYEEIFGAEKAKLKKEKHSGGNNSNAKKVLHKPSNKIFNSALEAMNFFSIKRYGSLYTRIKKGEFEFLKS